MEKRSKSTRYGLVPRLLFRLVSFRAALVECLTSFNGSKHSKPDEVPEAAVKWNASYMIYARKDTPMRLRRQEAHETNPVS